jgi:type II secretory ATPase GspE/PulE/Tfp pilus assembly ATPase PilB-like protein
MTPPAALSGAEETQRLAEAAGLPYLALRGKQVPPEVLSLVPTRVAHHYGVLPVAFEGEALVLALSAPLPPPVLDDLRLILQRELSPVLAGAADVQDALKRHYGVGADTLDELALPAGDALGASLEDGADLTTLVEDASVVKFVNQLLLEAVESRATDIHLEPYEGDLRIRRRIDGVLFDAAAPASIRHFQLAIISRIKVMAELDIGERRLPQDGRIQVKIGGNDLDLRVSILPTPFGESVTIRLLTSKEFLDLKRLGFFERDMAYLASLLERPHGIVLLTGPTGSGKTTTLYAFLSQINKEHTKIITIEDPIEYQLRGVTQIQVQPKIGLDFALGLRSMLRHDPDVMMVGEIRDLETAEIAIRVALTGHLVFSTLHTNDAAGSVTRLLDMGLEPFLVASSLECVIAQRLVRVLCEHCKEVDSDAMARFSRAPSDPPIFRGRGCERCHATGYRGRTDIYELLNVDRSIRELILARVSADRIRERAIAQGMRTLRQCGWDKVDAGLTTPEEVLRVTMKEEGA